MTARMYAAKKKAIYGGPSLVDRFLQDLGTVQYLNVYESRTLVKQARAGDSAAMDKAVRSVLPLAFATAKTWHKRNQRIPFEDLLGVANGAVMEAVRKYDVVHGMKLTTYAAWWLYGTLRRYVIGENFPGFEKDGDGNIIASHLREIHAAVEKEGDSDKTLQTIAKEHKIGNVRNLKNFLNFKRPVSLNQEGDDGLPLETKIQDIPAEEEYEHEMIDREVRIKVRDLAYQAMRKVTRNLYCDYNKKIRTAEKRSTKKMYRRARDRKKIFLRKRGVLYGDRWGKEGNAIAIAWYYGRIKILEGKEIPSFQALRTACGKVSRQRVQQSIAPYERQFNRIFKRLLQEQGGLEAFLDK